MLTGTDLVYPPNRWEAFQQALYSWDTRSLGTANPRILAWSVPQGIFLGISEAIGLSLTISQKVWFYFLFTFAGLSAFYLTTVVVKGKCRYLAGLTSALFYMLNPYIAIGITTFPYLWLTYASIPLKLGLYIKGIAEKKGLKYILFVCVVWWATSSSQYVNPKYLVLDWIPLLLYFAFHILVSKSLSETKRSLKFTGMLLCLLSFLNFYWILPAAFHSQEIIEAPVSWYAALGRNRLADYILNSAPLLDATRLLGLWALRSGFKGYQYYYWAPQFDTPLFIMVGYLIPLIALMSLLSRPKEKQLLFFGLFTVIALFLMNGVHPPLGEINVYLFTHIPWALDVFNAPYQIFGMYATLGYAFLFGYGIVLLYDRLKRAKLSPIPRRLQAIINITLVGFIVFLIVGLYAFPLWTGEVIYPGNPMLASNRYKIPNYYYEAGSWLFTQREDFRVFPLPYPILYYGAYAWEPAGFQGPDPTEGILRRSLVAGLSGNGMGMFVAKSITNNSATNNSTGWLVRMLSLMNVKYILFHKDVNWEFLEKSKNESVVAAYVYASPEQFQSILNSRRDLPLEKSFGELDFYRNEYWRPMHIYATPNAQLVDGGLDEMIQVIEKDNFLPGESVLLLSDQLEAQQISALPPNSSNTNSTDNVSVTYEKIDPTRYGVHVNASQPFFLVFSESYHEDWIAQVEGQQIPNEYHYMANGFANSWYINKTGSFTVTLEFWPQKLFYAGAAISITTLILCTLYISRDKIKTIYQRYIMKKQNPPLNNQK